MMRLTYIGKYVNDKDAPRHPATSIFAFPALVNSELCAYNVTEIGGQSLAFGPDFVVHFMTVDKICEILQIICEKMTAGHKKLKLALALWITLW